MTARSNGIATPDQRRAALVIANAHRLEVAAVKRRIAALDREAGRALVAEMLRDRVDLSMSVERLLKTIHGFGASRATRLLATARIAPSRRPGELTDRQRGVLAWLLVDEMSARHALEDDPWAAYVEQPSDRERREHAA